MEIPYACIATPQTVISYWGCATIAKKVLWLHSKACDQSENWTQASSMVELINHASNLIFTENSIMPGFPMDSHQYSHLCGPALQGLCCGHTSGCSYTLIVEYLWLWSVCSWYSSKSRKPLSILYCWYACINIVFQFLVKNLAHVVIYQGSSFILRSYIYWK